MTRILATLALAVALTPGVALADPTPSPVAPASPSLVESPAASPAEPVDGVRVGGTVGGRQPGAPAWVWCVGVAMVVAFGAGGVRLWLNRSLN